MGASRTETYEPNKVYFSSTEAALILDWNIHTLLYWTRQAGLESITRARGTWRRYSAEDINILMAKRKAGRLNKKVASKIIKNELYSDVSIKKFAPAPEKNL